VVMIIAAPAVTIDQPATAYINTTIVFMIMQLYITYLWWRSVFTTDLTAGTTGLTQFSSSLHWLYRSQSLYRDHGETDRYNSDHL
jgi:hypothetical protein